MGKASSSKKVARAAGIGSGRAGRRHTPWGYFGVIVVILVLGVVGTVASRDRRIAQINNAGGTAPTVGTTWNEGYAVYECGSFVPSIKAPSPPGKGINTKQAGIIHIQPTAKSVAGKNATLGKFAGTVGMKLNAAELQVPGGKLYQDGDTCEGRPGHVYVKQFAYVGDKVGQLYNGAKNQLPKLSPRDVPLSNGSLITIAFVPSGQAASIPPPPAAVQNTLKAIQQSSSSSTTTPAGSSTSTPAPSSTTAPSSSSTTATTKPAAQG